MLDSRDIAHIHGLSMQIALYIIGSLLIGSGFGMGAYTVYANFYSGRNVSILHLDAVRVSEAPGVAAQRASRLANEVEFRVDPRMAPIRIVATGTLGQLPPTSTGMRHDMVATVESVLPTGRPGLRATTTLQVEGRSRVGTHSEKVELLDIPPDWAAAERLRVRIEPRLDQDMRYRPSYAVTLQEQVMPFHKALILWIFAGPFLGFVCLHIGRHRFGHSSI